MKTWAKFLLYATLLVPGTFRRFVSWLIGPYALDDQQLDAIVMAVALDWRDFGQKQADQRLQYELDRQVGLQVGDDACGLTEDDAGRHVRCAWSVRVPLPGAALVIPLSFASEATITPDGDLR